MLNKFKLEIKIKIICNLNVNQSWKKYLNEIYYFGTAEIEWILVARKSSWRFWFAEKLIINAVEEIDL